jgi:DNA-3-methyladenine glycosylase
VTPLPRAFYTRPTLVVARELLGKHLVHCLPEGLVRGRIVETEAYPGIFDPASHTYRGQRTTRTRIWYGPGGFAYVYQIYGCYVCLGIIAEVEGTPGAVLIRALEPLEGLDLLRRHRQQQGRKAPDDPHRLCAGPAKLCLAMGITLQANHCDLCGNRLYLEEGEDMVPLEQMVCTPRINIDYAGAGALHAWRYAMRHSPALSRRSYEPLRAWRVEGYPSTRQPLVPDLFTYLAHEETQPVTAEAGLPAAERLRTRPKVELHLHLEGCMRVGTMRTLAARHRLPLPVHLQNQETHPFATFDEFAHTYYSICRLLVEAQDFALLAADLADYVRQNALLYNEVSWTPFLYLNRGLRFAEVMTVLNETLAEQGVRERVHFLIDVQRDHGLEAAAWVFAQVQQARDLQIVGIGLTGQEEGFAPAEYQALFQQAREHGLGLSAHAGEYGSADDIWQCVQQLGVSRLGHGLRAMHDPRLVRTLAAWRGCRTTPRIRCVVCGTRASRSASIPTIPVCSAAISRRNIPWPCAISSSPRAISGARCVMPVQQRFNQRSASRSSRASLITPGTRRRRGNDHCD